MRLFGILLLVAAAAFADGPGKIVSKHSGSDFALTADPNSKEWKGVEGVYAGNDAFGKPNSCCRIEIRSRWTDKNLYLLFIRPYETLYLNEHPSTETETNGLWNHDVAEVFIGTDFEHIKQYKELQVSPMGEWVDLDIDREYPKSGGGASWNSGYKVKAHIDDKAKIWYGEMQIPMSSIDARQVKAGNEMRINFYGFQGGPPDKTWIAWQPTNARNYHVPEAFGRLILGK